MEETDDHKVNKSQQKSKICEADIGKIFVEIFWIGMDSEPPLASDDSKYIEGEKVFAYHQSFIYEAKVFLSFCDSPLSFSI